MHQVPYGYTRTLSGVSFEEAIQRVTEALKGEGFGILTEIDVQATLKKKLDVDFRPYKILGACNPPLAHRALTGEPLIGLLLPCNVIIFDEGGDTIVSFTNPKEMFKLVEHPEMQAVAEEVDAKMRRALEAV